MPLVNMKPLLRDAMDNGYAVAAFNLVDYNTTKAMVKAAEELNAPVICQTSSKTIKYFSHKEIVSWVRTVAEDSPVPVVLHLDHCKDIPMIEACAKAGWTSIMIDASELPFEENLAQSLRVREIAEKYGDPPTRMMVAGGLVRHVAKRRQQRTKLLRIARAANHDHAGAGRDAGLLHQSSDNQHRPRINLAVHGLSGPRPQNHIPTPTTLLLVLLKFRYRASAQSGKNFE